MRNRERILANLESIYRETYDRARGADDAARMADLLPVPVLDGGQILFQLRDLVPQMQIAAVFLGTGLIDPPPSFKGGPFPMAPPYSSFLLPFPGLPQISIAQALPADIAYLDGVTFYIHALTREKSGPVTTFGFANVLKVTVGITPPAP